MQEQPKEPERQFHLKILTSAFNCTDEDFEKIELELLPDGKSVMVALSNPQLQMHIRAEIAGCIEARLNLVFKKESMEDALSEERYLAGKIDAFKQLLELGV